MTDVIYYHRKGFEEGYKTALKNVRQMLHIRHKQFNQECSCAIAIDEIIEFREKMQDTMEEKK